MHNYYNTTKKNQTRCWWWFLYGQRLRLWVSYDQGSQRMEHLRICLVQEDRADGESLVKVEALVVEEELCLVLDHLLLLVARLGPVTSAVWHFHSRSSA